MSYIVEQTVYEVGINFLTNCPNVTEQKILYVGGKCLFVSGLDPVWGTESESTLYLSLKESFDPSKVLSSNTHTVWTDNKEKAEQYASEMNNVLNLRSKISKTA
ncbi:hypothetical protein [Chryseobacterium sp. SG20098]|uniref:hypothetical protein n=1 Tax=Chryseobacterium sp. SG20098 TaxID=3074145 RepID=UPI002882E0E5|nr:hypothetical protein [Chryseobacterium sp. SG20098]WNI34669.1 hypothetical protein RHP76_11800 [Chryseobacterium sp. SG20098]